MNAPAAPEPRTPDPEPAVGSPPLRTWRPMLLWTAAILAALGMLVPVTLLGVAFRDAREALSKFRVSIWSLGRVNQSAGRHEKAVICLPRPTSRELAFLSTGGAQTEATALLTKGQAAAAWRLRVYLAFPQRLAPKRCEAAFVLGHCGGHGVNALVRLLADEDATTRCVAALALGWIGPEAAGAAPELRRLLQDPDDNPRTAAAQALEKIRSDEPPK